MSDFWSRMFDNPARQRDDITTLQADADHAFGRTLDNAERLDAAYRRIDKLELLLEATWELLKTRLELTDAELSLMAARVDLSDGVEDGRIGRGAPRRDAPTCQSCGRPRNPKRQRCVFCGEAAKPAAPAPPKKIRTTACSSCSQEVPERSVYFTERGTVCGPCFKSPGQQGGLALASEPGVQGEGGLELASRDAGGVSLTPESKPKQ